MNEDYDPTQSGENENEALVSNQRKNDVLTANTIILTLTAEITDVASEYQPEMDEALAELTRTIESVKIERAGEWGGHDETWNEAIDTVLEELGLNHD